MVGLERVVDSSEVKEKRLHLSVPPNMAVNVHTHIEQ